MNISITFRHMDSSSAVKAYAGEKIAKLQKFLRLPMTAKVTLSIDKLQHLAEARVSSGGQHLDACETSEDMYASIDMMIDKLERQIRGTKGAKVAKARRAGRASEVAPAAPKRAAATPKRTPLPASPPRARKPAAPKRATVRSAAARTPKKA